MRLCLLKQANRRGGWAGAEGGWRLTRGLVEVKEEKRQKNRLAIKNFGAGDLEQSGSK